MSTNDDDCVDNGNDINTNDDNLNQSATTTLIINSRTPLLKTHSMTSGSGGTGTSTSLTMPSYEILTRLDTKLCVTALEYLLTLLASQSLLAIKDINLSNREKQLIKRELSTEMLQFHDFVKKRILSLDPRGSLYRRKYGIRLIKNKQCEKKLSNDDVIVIDDEDDDGDGDDDNDDDDDDIENATNINEDRDNVQQPTPTPAVSKLSMRDSMRVNVMRKVHLTTQQQQLQHELHKTVQSINPSSSTFNFTSNISPISGSTPKRSNLNISTSTPMDQHYDEQSVGTTADDDESLQYLEPIEPTFTGLSYVNLVEEDYFHFLSNLFTVICQNE